MRRVKYVLVTEEFLGRFLVESKDCFRVLKGLPEGSEFLNASYTDKLGAFRLYYTHPSFEEVKEGYYIPEFGNVELESFKIRCKCNGTGISI